MSDRPAPITRPRTGRTRPHRLRWWFLARTGDPVAKLLAPGFRGDPYALYEHMRAHGPLHHSRTGLRAVMSYDDCGEALQNPHLKATEPSPRPLGERAPTLWVPGLGGTRATASDHAQAVASPLLRPVLHSSLPRIEAVAHGLLRQRAGAGFVDVVDHFAFPLAVACLGELLGVPAAHSARFTEMCHTLGRPLHGTPSGAEAEARHDAKENLAALVIRLEHERGRSPGDDLISRLSAPRHGNQAGDDVTRLLQRVRRRDPRKGSNPGVPRTPGTTAGQLTLEEVAAVCETLTVFGLDTAVCLIGNAIAALGARPEQWQLLRSAPQLAGEAMEETLRFDPPRPFALRFAGEHVRVAGRTLPRGSGLLVVLAAARRDPARFHAPDQFDLTRGSGPHLAADGDMTLATSWARLTAETALRVLADGLPRLRLAGQAVRRPGGVVRGFTRLPVHASPTA
ncbi:cytochrome P450 [Streptomyces sp. NPDC014656]|uniref:cytochrome P450 n=1 Tax=Streptomyces sp. NPDC014656 TaxID=3364878 RepID=UPI0036F7CE0C